MPNIKREDGKPIGRRSAYSYFFQACFKETGSATLGFSEFTRLCGGTWQIMTELEKRPFQELAFQDRIRYDREMEMYLSQKQGGRKLRRRRWNPSLPKRPLSAYFWFCQDRRGQLKTNNPEMGLVDLAKALGRMWGETSPVDKKVYEIMASKDRDRYFKDKEMQKQTHKDNYQEPGQINKNEEHQE